MCHVADMNSKDSRKIKSPVEEYVDLDIAELEQIDIYKLLIGSILPRPIAFVSTINKEGITNCAPFSAFNLASSNPPCLMFSVACDRVGYEKDTLRNIKETEEFVVNSANSWLLEEMVSTAARYPYGESEVDLMGFTPSTSTLVGAPGIAESAVQFECKLYKLIEIGGGEVGSSHIVVGEIVYAHVDKRCYSSGRILLDEYSPVSKLSGFDYALVGEKIKLKVPDLES